MKIEKNIRGISGIYKITNLINNKFYIGSSLDMYQRAYTYKCLAKQNRIHNEHLQNSFNLYGIDNFSFSVLECINFDDNLSKNQKLEILQKSEQLYINELSPAYNIRKFVDRNTAINHSTKTKDKLSMIMKESFKSGKRKINRIYSHNIKVSLFTLEGVHIKDFPGLSHCAEFVGVNPTSIGIAIRRDRKIVKNYIVLKTKNKDDVAKYIKFPKIKYGKRVKILDIDNDNILEFTSCKDCCKYLHCKWATMVAHAKNKKLIKCRYKVLEYD